MSGDETPETQDVQSSSQITITIHQQFSYRLDTLSSTKPVAPKGLNYIRQTYYKQRTILLSTKVNDGAGWTLSGTV